MILTDENLIQDAVIEFLRSHDGNHKGLEPSDLAIQVSRLNSNLVSDQVFDVILDMGASGVLDIREGLVLRPLEEVGSSTSYSI